MFYSFSDFQTRSSTLFSKICTNVFRTEYQNEEAWECALRHIMRLKCIYRWKAGMLLADIISRAIID